MTTLRRDFLKAALRWPMIGFFSTFSFMWPHKTKKHYFIHSTKCHFPKEMSFEKFTDISTQWTKASFIPTLDTNFIKSGQLLRIDRKIRPKSVQWTYVFKDRAAFEHWSQVLWSHNVFDADKVLSGYVYDFSYQDLASTHDKARLPLYSSSPLSGVNLQRFIKKTLV